MEFMGDVGRLKDRKVLVVGDLSIDKYWTGSAHRLSPEAPCPVVNLDPHAPDIHEVPGCAGNVAANVCALGGVAAIIGAVGDDDDGHRLKSLLDEMTINTDWMVFSSRPTISKTRIMSGQYHICRVDVEMTDDYSNELLEPITNGIMDAIGTFKPDVLYLADYDKGLLTTEVIKHSVGAAHETGIPVVADPKLRHFLEYKCVDVLKPNEVRAGEAMGMPIITRSQIEEMTRAIYEHIPGLSWVLLTRGDKGMFLSSATAYDSDDPLLEKPHPGIEEYIPARYVEISELSGAGDTTGAALCLAMAGGMNVPEAARLANVAASIVVQKTGTSLCTPSELAEALANV